MRPISEQRTACSPRQKQNLAVLHSDTFAYHFASNAWSKRNEAVPVSAEPMGPGIPKPPYNAGKGYYDPTHHVFVVQTASSNRLWV